MTAKPVNDCANNAWFFRELYRLFRDLLDKGKQRLYL